MTASTTHLRERLLLATCAALTLTAFVAPGLVHPHDHGFADARGWLGIPCAMDVLSNLAFAGMGLWGLVMLARGRRAGINWLRDAQASALLFFTGLLLTAAGSSWYHWQPDDAGLVWDRAAMVVAFAGMLGLAAGSRVSARAGNALAAYSLVAGLVAVAAWRIGGNLLPWAIVQFGGMALVLALACMRSLPHALNIPLVVVIVIYALAKGLELADVAVFEFTGGLVSGHTLKHVVASLAAVPVLRALTDWPVPVLRHNARSTMARA